MNEIIATQHDRAKPLTGKTFLLSVASIVLRLAAAQIAVNLAISLTGLGLLNVLFYAYAVWLLFGFMRHTVASYTYMLKAGTLVLQRRMGDSTTTLIEIPLEKIRAVRPVRFGEDMHLYYKQVTTIDPACRPSWRIRAGFLLSYVSAHAARAAAGKKAGERAGYAVVFEEDGALRCCMFRPNEKLCAALEDACEGFGADDFAGRQPLGGVRARCLQKAFPELYPHVRPLMDAEQVEAAHRELAERRAKRKAAKAAKPSGKAKKKSGDKHEVHDDSV